MKKIIATVLAMVMALALCTVSFADNTTTELKTSDGYDIYLTAGTTSQLNAGVRKISKTVTGNATAADGTVTYTAPQYTDGTKYWDEVDQSVADAKLVNTKNNTVVAYLKAGTNTLQTATVVVTKFVEKTDAQDCGDYTKDVFVSADGKVYEADTNATKWAVMNGKFVGIASETALDVTTAGNQNVVEHVFTATSKATYATDGTPATITCDKCKKEFKVVKSAGVAGLVSGYQQLTTAPAAFKTDTDWYALTGSTVINPSTDKNTSPKTFDAGIAMYVGMALTSVAGSAVVIGKKKEF